MRCLLFAVASLWAAEAARAQAPGDSVRLRGPGDSTWFVGRVLAATPAEIVVGTTDSLQVFQRGTLTRLERWNRRRPEWVMGLWGLGGLAAGTLVAALTSDDAGTEDIVLSIGAGAVVGVAAGFFDFRLRPGSWVAVPPP